MQDTIKGYLYDAIKSILSECFGLFSAGQWIVFSIAALLAVSVTFKLPDLMLAVLSGPARSSNKHVSAAYVLAVAAAAACMAFAAAGWFTPAPPRPEPKIVYRDRPAPAKAEPAPAPFNPFKDIKAPELPSLPAFLKPDPEAAKRAEEARLAEEERLRAEEDARRKRWEKQRRKLYTEWQQAILAEQIRLGFEYSADEYARAEREFWTRVDGMFSGSR